ncbi:MAG: PKD domain-containing protein, partial [Chloroflexi bacterium]|nr:PKD domain-containing protein [Chloroflexota bacterium]
RARAFLSSFIVVLLLGMLLVSALPGAVSAEPGVLRVGTCSGCYSTIQGAIDAASPGDMIIVEAGIYEESVVVNKPLMLLGAQANVDPRPSKGGRSGPESIVVSPSTGLSIKADNVVVNGFTFRSRINNSSYNIVEALGAGFPQILYNIVYNENPSGTSNEGIKVRYSYDKGALVAYNYVYNIPSPGDAINFDGVTGGFISNNEVRNISSENAAIYVYNSSRTTINCNLVDTTTQNDGIKLGSKNGSDAAKLGGVIVGNTVRNTKQDGIAVYMSDTCVENNKVSGSTSENGAIYVAFGVSNITIRYNELHGNTLTTGKWGNPGAIMIGTAVNAATVSVNNNNIYNNTPYGVTNKATADLDARYNWWGNASGPSGQGPGSGDAVSANVTFSPWLERSQTIVDPCVPNSPPVANPNGPYLGAVNTYISFDGTASSDPDSDPLTYTWDFGDNHTGTGANPSHSYAVAGIYNVCLTVNDGHVDSDPVCTIAVIYDPAAGFVTGGGWIDSPVNEVYQYMNIGGKATFGFVARYKKGATVPDGNTQFQFKAGNLNFHSTSYQWLVV